MGSLLFYKKGETKMNKPNVSKITKDIKTVISKRSPEILTGIGIAGMITTTILAVKATPKALTLLEDAEYDKGEPLKATEKVKAAWKPYIPAVVTGTVSTACLIGASSVNARRNAALATAYQLSTTALSEYKEKVVETIGEKKEQVIRENIAKDKVEKNPVNSTKEVIITGKGKTLCCDLTFNQYFESDIDSIKKAINEINYRLTTGGEEYVSLNDFYDELGVPRIDIGEELGWNVSRDGLLDVSFSTTMSSDDRPCITIQYHVAPRYNYHKLM